MKNSPRYCLDCGDLTNSYYHYLCDNCYHSFDKPVYDLYYKYNMRTKNLERLSCEFENRYICSDGHRVKSKAEEIIDNYFFDNDIKHAYEREISFDDGNNKFKISPDFCVYKDDMEIFIEYWGVNNDPNYERNKALKMSAYKRLGLTLINLYSWDYENLIPTLEYRLNNYKKNEINFEE